MRQVLLLDMISQIRAGRFNNALFTQMHDTDSEITRGGRVVRRIARRIVQHKIIFAVVIVIILAIIALLIFGIVEIKKSQKK